MGDELMWALKNGDLDAVKEALPGVDLNAPLPGGRCPLHYAADYGHNDLLTLLLSKGANVNAFDKHGICPLLAAVYEGHTGAVKLLLSQGAQKDLKGPDNLTAMDVAQTAEMKEMLR